MFSERCCGSSLSGSSSCSLISGSTVTFHSFTFNFAKIKNQLIESHISFLKDLPSFLIKQPVTFGILAISNKTVTFMPPCPAFSFQNLVYGHRPHNQTLSND